ncbi:hypothetical protein [Paraburkholderia strydomiana]|uniref:hypothetical protein n=1 Tax=Paraburkholderia strydomiana TaxID=1245417 RepID=UPI0038BCF801
MDVKEARKLGKQFDRLVKNLTTPAVITDFIREFCGSLSDQEPVFIECQPEPWSRQSCCDLNVREFIRIAGRGVPQYGYRIWYNANPIYVEAESHVIWRDGKELRDVSFCADGEDRTLFLPIHSSFSGTFDDIAKKKARKALLGLDKRALAAYEEVQNSIPVEQFPDDVAWDTMPTWEEWQTGRRASDTIPGVGRSS